MYEVDSNNCTRLRGCASKCKYSIAGYCGLREIVIKDGKCFYYSPPEENITTCIIGRKTS